METLFYLKFPDGLIISSDDADTVFLVVALHNGGKGFELRNLGKTPIVTLDIPTRSVEEFANDKAKVRKLIELVKDIESFEMDGCAMVFQYEEGEKKLLGFTFCPPSTEEESKKKSTDEFSP